MKHNIKHLLRPLRPGDTFIIQVKHNLFGAYRVLGCNKKTEGPDEILALASSWEGENEYSTSYKELTTPHLQSRYLFLNQPLCFFIFKPIPDDHIYIGNIQLTEQEQSIQVNCGLPRWKVLANCIHHEWKWKNDSFLHTN